MSSNVRASLHTANHFSPRALAVGLVIGILNCICNTHFILQAGWGTDLSMSSSLVAFTIFKFRSFARRPFTAAKNVLVQTVASTTGMITLSCGFAGVFPALEFLLKPKEGVPVDLNLGRLMLWSLGICLVGSTFSAFLGTQMILKERLKYPTGIATATLISVLHGVPSGHSQYDSDVATSTTNETQDPLFRS